MRQRKSAEIQVRDTAKHWTGQHNKDCRIAENANSQYDRNYNTVRGPYQRCRLVSRNVVLDRRASDSGVIILATQLSTAKSIFIGILYV